MQQPTKPLHQGPFEQGTLIAVDVFILRNVPAWDKWRTYLPGDFVLFRQLHEHDKEPKFYKAIAPSIDVFPVGNPTYWTEDSGRIDPSALAFNLSVPGFAEVKYTLTSPATIISKVDTGWYRALVDSTPSRGIYKGEWAATGAVQAVGPWIASVVPSTVPLL